MQRRLFLFQWRVPEEGHIWQDAPLEGGGAEAGQPRRVLVPRADGHEVKYTFYEPLAAESGLFLVFAALRIDETAILQFADRYGPLAEADRVRVPKAGSRRPTIRRGDRLDRWANHLLSMKACRALWESARRENRDGLARTIVTLPRAENTEFRSSLVQVTPQGTLQPREAYRLTPTSFGYTANLGGHRVPLGSPARFAFRHFAAARTAPATFYEGRRIGFMLPAGRRAKGRLGGFGVTYPADAVPDADPVALARLLVTTEIARNLEAGLQPVIVHRPRAGWGELRFAPGTLIEALWLQFAEAVCQDKDYRHCEVCGKPFELSPGVARTNRRLCSSNCKVKAHRQRKDRVIRLWERHITLPTILRESGSSPEHVKKWLAKHLKGKGLSARAIARELEASTSEVNAWLRKRGG